MAVRQGTAQPPRDIAEDLGDCLAQRPLRVLAATLGTVLTLEQLRPTGDQQRAFDSLYDV